MCFIFTLWLLLSFLKMTKSIETKQKHKSFSGILIFFFSFFYLFGKQKSSCRLRGDEGEEDDGGMLFGVLLREGT